jgi:cysteine desulfurase/selenocysteine lyase
MEQELNKIEGLRIIGNAAEKSSLTSFIVEDIHPFDIGSLLDQMGIAVRTGHHCTQPLMERFGLIGTVRASIAFYNNEEDIMQFIGALNKSLKMLRG